MAKSRVALVVPAYNESLTIRYQISELSKIGDVVVVNDGSTDGTKSICEAAPCKLINLSYNLGYDYALEKGIKSCSDYDFVITTDADGEIPFSSVIKAKENLLAGSDCVLGVRNKVPRFGEKLVNRVIHKKYMVKDIFCGLKGYRVERINTSFTMENSVGTALALSFLKGARLVTTVNVDVKNRVGESRFGNNDLKTNLKLLKVLRYVY